MSMQATLKATKAELTNVFTDMNVRRAHRRVPTTSRYQTEQVASNRSPSNGRPSLNTPVSSVALTTLKHSLPNCTITFRWDELLARKDNGERRLSRQPSSRSCCRARPQSRMPVSGPGLPAPGLVGPQSPTESRANVAPQELHHRICRLLIVEAEIMVRVLKHDHLVRESQSIQLLGKLLIPFRPVGISLDL